MKRILIFTFASVTLFACKKELNFTKPKPEAEKRVTQELYLQDVALERPGARTMKSDPGFFEKMHWKTKVVLLEFDGFVVRNSSWNFSSDAIVCKPSKLSQQQKEAVIATVREDYSPWNIEFTTSESIYNRASKEARQRVIICDSSWEWFGKAGGVSYIGSMFWGDDTPSFVFADLLGHITKNVAEATTHEIGHTIGLNHYPDWQSNCTKKSDYWPGIGTGTLDYSNIMGVGYYKHVVGFENHARSLWECDGFTNQVDLITQALGKRIDLIGDNFRNAINVERPTQIRSVLENSDDIDMFEVDWKRINAVSLVSGGNSDFKIEIYIDNKLKGVYEDMGSLNVSKRPLLVNRLKRRFAHNRVFISVMRQNDDPSSFIPPGSSTGGYVLQLY